MRTHDGGEGFVVMKTAIVDGLLWLFVLNQGIAVGAGLYEQRLVLPLWFVPSPGGPRVDGEAMRRIDSGRRFWAFVTTGPLTLLTLIGLFAVGSAEPPVRPWWTAALALSVAERTLTFGYFIPRALRLMRNDTDSKTASHLAARWLRANHLRILLALAGWLAALRALSLGSGVTPKTALPI